MYPIHQYSRLERSIVNDIKQNNKIAFLFGSAVSASPDGSGVPDTQGVISLIKEYLIEKDMVSKSELDIITTELANDYQSWFDYLLSVGSQNDAQEVVERAVLKAKDPITEEWVLPPSLKYFGQLVGSKHFKLDCVLTTNFDPLIQESLKINGITSINYYCESNTHVNTSEPYEEGVKVLHLHGFWKSDTMHTTYQLETDRRAVTDSIKSILNGAKLYIVGYGGWNDVVRKALKELMVDPDAKYEIRWCFFEEDEKRIMQNYSHLLEEFSEGRSRSRLQFYKGVDCHSLFRSIHEQIPIFITDELGTVLTDSKKHTEILPISQVFHPKKRQITQAEPKPYKINRDEPHHTVRLQQQLQAAQALDLEQCVHLQCIPGCGQFGFLSALIDTLQDKNLTYFVTRIDLSKVTSREQFDEQFLKDVGCDIMILLNQNRMERILLLVDNLDASNPELCNQANILINLAKDSQQVFSVIILTVNPAQLDCKTVLLGDLLPEDVKEYLKCGNSDLDLSPLAVDSISLITSSLPLKLDVVRRYLKIMTIPELLANQSLSESLNAIDEGIPSALHSKLIELSKSESPENIKLYNLTKVMSILSGGHKASRIMNLYKQYKFQPEDFLRLIDYGFIYSVSKPEIDAKFVRINPLVRDYILRSITSEDLVNQGVEAISLLAGESWNYGQVRVSNDEKSMLEYQDFLPGNVHSIILLLMQLSLARQENKLYEQCTQAAVSYCMYLLRMCFFKQLVNFARSTLQLHCDSNSLSYYQISYHLAEALRMLSQRDESVALLEGLLDKFKAEPFFSSTLEARMLSTLALACQVAFPVKALEYARNLNKKSSRGSYSRLVSEQVITEIEYKGIERVTRLKRLEKQARNKDHTILANNIRLVLARLVKSECHEHLDKVLQSTEGDIYNRCRAVLAKVEIELDRYANSSDFPSSHLFRQCVTVYRYLFLQRLTELFNRSHEVLWRVANLSQDVEQLYLLFRNSSLVWRLAGDLNTELKYAQQLRSMPVIALLQHQECRSYLDGRLNYIQNES